MRYIDLKHTGKLSPGMIIQGVEEGDWNEEEAIQELNEFRTKQLYRWLQHFLSFTGMLNYMAKDNYVSISLCHNGCSKQCCTIECIEEFRYKIKQPEERDMFISGLKRTVDYVNNLIKKIEEKIEGHEES